MTPATTRRPWWRLVAAVAVAAAAVSLAGVRLADYPASWYDEGVHLNGVYTLARTGHYGTTDARGLTPYDPQVQVGPTVVLPAALAVRMLDGGAGAARLPVAVYALLAVLLGFAATWRLGRGHFAAALLAAAWLAAGTPEPFTSVLYVGRQLLGEAPALAWLLLGLLAFDVATASDRWRLPGSLGAGVALGLAAITKGQLLIVLPPALGIVLLVAAVRRQRGRDVPVVLAVGLGFAVPVLAWIGSQVAAIGPTAYLDGLAQLRVGVAAQILSPAPAYVHRALGSLWRSGFAITGVAGVAWMAWRAVRAGGIATTAWAVTTVVILGWFVVASVGWARYGVYAVALTSCLTAAALADTARWRPRLGAALLLGGYLWAGYNAVGAGQALLASPDGSQALIERAVRSQLPPSARIESWEWDVGQDMPERFTRPPLRDVYRVTDELMRHGASVGVDDPLGPRCADYLLEGPFSSWTGHYRRQAHARVQPVAVVGPYALFALPPSRHCRGGSARAAGG